MRGQGEFDIPSSLHVAEVLFVGESGHGELTIDSGGSVESDRGVIGYQLGNPNSGGVVTVRGVGESGRRSQWLVTDTLLVGDRSGPAELNVRDAPLSPPRLSR